MANFNFNKVIIGGRLCSDPELRSAGGISHVTATVAVNRRFKNKDGQIEADFVPVEFWRQQAEFVSRYFRKGSSICAVGEVRTRSWDGEDGKKHYATSIVCDEVHFVDSKSDGEGTAQGASPAAVPCSPQFEDVADDDLPF